MKSMIKGLNVTVKMSVNFGGSYDEIPNQESELSEIHFKDADLGASVELSAGIEEATTDMTPDEFRDTVKGLLDVTRQALEQKFLDERARKEHEELQQMKRQHEMDAKELEKTYQRCCKIADRMEKERAHYEERQNRSDNYARPVAE